PLRESLCACREVSSDGGYFGCDAFGIEDVDIGDEPFSEEPTVGKAPSACGLESQHADSLFESACVLVSYPGGKEVRLEGAVGDLAHVGAGVREGHDGAGMCHEGDDVGRVGSDEVLDEELLEVAFECEIDDELDGVDAALGGDIDDDWVGRDAT